MWHRILNKGGKWHRPASLKESEWSKFSFEMSWQNLNKMFNLRKYYLEIAPPFSTYAPKRVGELEELNDDILYFHVKKSFGYLIFWIFFTVFVVDYEDMDAPSRHFLTNDQEAHDFERTREGYLI